MLGEHLRREVVLDQRRQPFEVALDGRRNHPRRQFLRSAIDRDDGAAVRFVLVQNFVVQDVKFDRDRTASAAHCRAAVDEDELAGGELQSTPAEPGCLDAPALVFDLGRDDRNPRAKFRHADDPTDANLFV